jgi:acyl-CoA synthetase (AMP-forming)/AMP-acid ligase II
MHEASPGHPRQATNEWSWNFADIWEVVAESIPDAPALVQGTRRFAWREMDRRANGIAGRLLGEGFARQDKVAHYLYNCPEYLESTFGILKAALVPVNTNYRYGDDELVYLWDNADVVAVIFHGTFTERVARVRSRVPRVRLWVFVDDGTGSCPEWAVPYEELAVPSDDRVLPPWGRSGDDLYLLYTGGTTGMPKGVMWRQDDLFVRLNRGNLVRIPEDEGLEGVRRTVTAPGPVHLPACPLMHGTGAFTSLAMLALGGCVVTLVGRSFDPVELLETVERERVNVIAIVGDAFAKPILRALDEHPGRYRLDSLVAIISSGVIWSEQVKEGLLRHHPNMMLLDAMSSSEALGIAASVSSGSSAEHTAQFRIGPDVRVLTPDGREVEPGSGEPGLLALGGRNPLGYYKDPDKTAATFKVIDGVRYSIPGDWATVEADGVIHLLGRGSVCINTGGEKVFPEEVEEVLKLHPAVADAVVVGLPDDRFGEVVSAAVQLEQGGAATEEELIAWVRARLAAYKAPKRVRFVDTVGRSPSGKVDYGRHRREMAEWAASHPAGPHAARTGTNG